MNNEFNDDSDFGTKNGFICFVVFVRCDSIEISSPTTAKFPAACLVSASFSKDRLYSLDVAFSEGVDISFLCTLAICFHLNHRIPVYGRRIIRI